MDITDRKKNAASASAMGAVSAMILAGGLGTRLRSALPELPKVLAPIHGRPFIHYLLDQVGHADISSCILCTGYRGEVVEAAVESRIRPRCRFSREPAPLGTGGAIQLALPMVETPLVLIMNGDSFVDVDLADFIRRCRNDEAAMLTVAVPDTSRYGRVAADVDGQVLRFDEKKKQAGAGQINAGIYLFRTESLRSAVLPEQAVSSFERDWLPRLIGNGLYSQSCTARFIDIGTPESYARAEQVLPAPDG